MRWIIAFLALWCSGPCFVHAVTVYDQTPQGVATVSGTASGKQAASTNYAAYNDSVVDPPAVPDPGPATTFMLDIAYTNTSASGVGIPVHGSFWGFSIEMSVMNQVVGRNSTYLQPQFLNLMSNIVQRGGTVYIRSGGNTQDYAFMVSELANGLCISKQGSDTNNPTLTPSVTYTEDFFYMLANVSSLVDVKWFLGIPFNDTNWRLDIVKYGQDILGGHLVAFQAGNEPDFYVAHGHRDQGWGPANFTDEFAELISAMQAASYDVNGRLIGPSIATGDWTPEQVWATVGFQTTYKNNLYGLSIEHYPDNNCVAMYGGPGAAKVPQEVFPDYLNHTAPTSLLSIYMNSSSMAQDIGLPFWLLETNTASCGGFYGVSDSFGAALWALDLGLQMAYSNFTGGLLHVGGQNVFYNPFTAPPTSMTAYSEFTIGMVFYSSLILAETLGNSDTAQVLDLLGNDANIYTPQYAIYEHGALVKVALFNYITDSSSASDYVATINLQRGSVPSSVRVKYFSSASVSNKKDVTWAGQSFGSALEVDGILHGELNTTTISCDTSANTCAIPVHAPAFALVLMTDGGDDYLTDEKSLSALSTFATTVTTKTENTATIASQVLATSNGMKSGDFKFHASSSKGSVSSSAPPRIHRLHWWEMAVASVLVFCTVYI
ncbi:glycoside hydrolase family 79 protein [Fistulina hepatica ATCC 64428]|uniref:Glycoside hydrolase family 79 protein n=1 Tax=Fistulina hepatica ATCC 64428 TaxID=1128425 RepID=A0A0D7APS0_9AGAR|nr:glycoside hydrolase family 79 protein [Fistulina hepatica ATCC 64428]